MRRLGLAVAALLVTLTSAIVATTPPADAATSFRGWVFTPVVSAIRSDGLSLEDVSYDGVKVFDRISLPVMSVFYDNNICGPYADRIGGSSYVFESATEYTQDGVRWLQIGLTDQIGAYVITQMFYLSENGQFDAHIFSKGLQCNARHDHVPFLRIDFDIAGTANDQIRRATASGPVAMPSEFSMSATAAVGHGWEVHDTVTGDFVTVHFDDGNVGFPGETVIPESDYIENSVFGRQYHASEQQWQGGPSFGLFGDEGETMTDVVMWYSGFMPHSPEEGPSLWHSTGIRMQVNPDTSQQASIAGRVIDNNGNPVDDAKVDLFTENRAQFLGTTRTNASGHYSFPVAGGSCYVLTFIAPGGTTFSGGGRFLNEAVCVAPGQTSGGHDATVIVPGGGSASVGDRVTFSDGSPASGVKLNLFTENRAQFLGVTFTDGNGNYRFDLASPMCGVVTFIAPVGMVFAGTGTGFQNTAFCASAGEAVTDVDAVLVGGGGQGTLGDRVTEVGGGGVGGVKLVLYQADGDGSRGAWIRPTFTDSGGNYQFSVAPGCYVIDFVAPPGRTWVSTGGQFQQLFGCVSAGGTNNTLDGVLS